MLGTILFVIAVAITCMAVALLSLNYKKSKIAKLPPLSPTLRFVNGTFAIMTIMNSGHYKIFAGQFQNSKSKAASRQLLKDWWSITDKQSGLKAVEDLSLGMHDTEYLEGVEEYNDSEENEIPGWNLSRANEVLSRLYLAGYIDKDSYIHNAITVSKQIQETFTSWDDFISSYMYGYQQWSGDDPTIDSKKPHNYQQRERVIKLMKHDTNSPLYLDWNTTLKND